MTIDANIIIAYLAGEAVVVRHLSGWKEAGLPLLLPSVVETEVLSFSGWSEVERAHTERFLESEFLFVPLERREIPRVKTTPVTTIALILRAISSSINDCPERNLFNPMMLKFHTLFPVSRLFSRSEQKGFRLGF